MLRGLIIGCLDVHVAQFLNNNLICFLKAIVAIFMHDRSFDKNNLILCNHISFPIVGNVVIDDE